MARGERPLSPHLGIYRWKISNTLSIIHRMTGVMLSLGALVLVGWLVSLAVGYGAYSLVGALLASPLGGLMLFGLSFCLFYHLANGIRHLFWDMGRGFEMHQARMSGVAVIIVALILTLGLWITALTGAGGGP